MRGISKLLTMLALAAGLAVVPAIGSQGAGALGERRAHADALIVADDGGVVRRADDLAQAQVIKLASR
jgi:hypothetical protein